MIGFVLALVSFGLVLMALYGVATIERGSRLAGIADRPELQAPKRAWGGGPERPPSHYAAIRGLAAAARLARGRTFVPDASSALRRSSRILSLVATASALSILPFAGSFGAQASGRPLLVLDLEYGLGVLVFLILISGLAQASTGLAERSLWARLAALRVAGQSLIGVALLLLVLAPLVLATSSLRPFDLVLFQQGSFAPLALFGSEFMGIQIADLDALRLPNWFLFRQPLTAILIIPTLGLLLQRYSVYDTQNNTSGMSGFGLDSDPSDHYWMTLESRLSAVLAAAIFVTFFLGASSIPYFDPRSLLEQLEPYLGQGFPAFLLAGFEFSVFATKLLFVLFAASLLRRSTGRARSDQSLHMMTRRLIPLAWANLLLLSALSLLSTSSVEGLR